MKALLLFSTLALAAACGAQNNNDAAQVNAAQPKVLHKFAKVHAVNVNDYLNLIQSAQGKVKITFDKVTYNPSDTKMKQEVLMETGVCKETGTGEKLVITCTEDNLGIDGEKKVLTITAKPLKLYDAKLESSTYERMTGKYVTKKRDIGVSLIKL